MIKQAFQYLYFGERERGFCWWTLLYLVVVMVIVGLGIGLFNGEVQFLGGGL